jgi:hypothetical protein
MATRQPHPATLDPTFQDELLVALEKSTGAALPS